MGSGSKFSKSSGNFRKPITVYVFEKAKLLRAMRFLLTSDTRGKLGISKEPAIHVRAGSVIHAGDLTITDTENEGERSVSLGNYPLRGRFSFFEWWRRGESNPRPKVFH